MYHQDYLMNLFRCNNCDAIKSERDSSGNEFSRNSQTN